MDTKRKSPLILALVLILLLLLPAALYYALTSQSLFRFADALGTATVNIVPTETTANIGETFDVEVHINTIDKPLSGAKLVFVYDKSKVSLVNINPELGAGKPFTDMVYDPDVASNTIHLFAKRSAGELIKGSHKIVTLTFTTLSDVVDGNIGIDTALTEIVGANPGSNNVAFTVEQGTTGGYTIVGQLCKIAACTLPASITLTERSRTDNRLNIDVAWTGPSATESANFYKVYRAVEGSIPANHSTVNPILVTQGTSFTDKYYGGGGFTGGASVKYDIDTYARCTE